MNKPKYVYERNDGRWEARYIKGVSPEGKALYGAVYGSSAEEVIKKRRDLAGETDQPREFPKELNLLILGAGSHGRNIKEIADKFRIFKNISFLDDKVIGPNIIGKCKDALKFRNEYGCAFVAIGDNKKRKKYAKFLKERNFIIPSFISPHAIISDDAEIGEGVAILPQSTVGNAKIGDYCILASNSLVNSGSVVGSFSHVDCGAIVMKDAKIPAGTWIKSGEIFTKNKQRLTPAGCK